MHKKQATVRDGGAGAMRGMPHDPGAGRDSRLAFIVASQARSCVWAPADRPYHSVPPGNVDSHAFTFCLLVCTALNPSKEPHNSRLFCGVITMQSGIKWIFTARPYANPARDNQSPVSGRLLCSMRVYCKPQDASASSLA